LVAIDTNILVYAHRADSIWYSEANAIVREIAEGPAAWAIPWPCIHEFYSVVTNPRIFKTPTPRHQAIFQIDAWLMSPTLELLRESTSHWARLSKLIESGKLQGPRVHDARIAAICISHGVRELWSADRDFSQMPALKTRNPLLPAK